MFQRVLPRRLLSSRCWTAMSKNRKNGLLTLQTRGIASLHHSSLDKNNRNNNFNDCSRRRYSFTTPISMANSVSFTYVDRDGTEHKVQAEIGKNLMDVAHENDIDLEGACGGELACSTCHLVFEKQIFDTLPEKQEEEDDMLDMAFELTETSRLGCQIPVQENFEGMKVQIPDDGFN